MVGGKFVGPRDPTKALAFIAVRSITGTVASGDYSRASGEAACSRHDMASRGRWFRKKERGGGR
jgi:hypothetical protein